MNTDLWCNYSDLPSPLAYIQGNTNNMNKELKDLGNGWSVTNHGGQPMGLTDKQYAIFIGRFQPLHNGHIALFRQKLDAGIPLLIMVRDLQPDERNPFTTEQTVKMLKKVFKDQDVKVMIIPDIESVNWGRGVGYELNEFVPPADLGAVSATAIRNGIKDGNADWKKMVDPIIQKDIIKYLKENNLIVA